MELVALALSAPELLENGSRRRRFGRREIQVGILRDAAGRHTRHIVGAIFRTSRNLIQGRGRGRGGNGSKAIFPADRRRRRIIGSVELQGEFQTIHNSNLLRGDLEKGLGSDVRHGGLHCSFLDWGGGSMQRGGGFFQIERIMRNSPRGGCELESWGDESRNEGNGRQVVHGEQGSLGSLRIGPRTVENQQTGCRKFTIGVKSN